MLDFGIAGKTAVVCASSKGLGYGCADALAAVGVNLVMNARTPETLAAAAAHIRDAHGVEVKEVPADITTTEGRAAVLEAAGHVDILVNNAGGPPPGDFRDWTRETWITALDANMLAAFELIKAVVDPMIDNRVRTDRQHHLGIGEVAHCPARPFERRACRADRVSARASHARWRSIM